MRLALTVWKFSPLNGFNYQQLAYTQALVGRWSNWTCYNSFDVSRKAQESSLILPDGFSIGFSSWKRGGGGVPQGRTSSTTSFRDYLPCITYLQSYFYMHNHAGTNFPCSSQPPMFLMHSQITPNLSQSHQPCLPVIM